MYDLLVNNKNLADRMKAHYTVLNEEGDEVEKSNDFAHDVQQGLSKKSKTIPCKYFYDDEGVQLFCQITELDEYYLTDCEFEILENHKEDILRSVGTDNFNLVELGAGDGKKTRVLINHILKSSLNVEYIPIDISEEAIRNLISDFNGDNINIRINGLVADYFGGIKWLSKNGKRPNLVLFLGSNIGNFDKAETDIFLGRLHDALNLWDFLLIGFDLKKDVSVLNKAYNDSLDITAYFNLNLLNRINRELGGDFEPGLFKYYGSFNEDSGAVESYLVSQKDHTVHLNSLGQSFTFEKGESIHTENSFKFTESEISSLAGRSGFKILKNFTDSKGYFVDSLWQKITKE
jgi:dimethylhistidine N-methyltransferase